MKPYILIILSFVLFLIGIWIGRQSFQPISPETLVKKVTRNIHHSLQLAEADALQIMEDAAETNKVSFTYSSDYGYSFFIYDSTSLLYWSDNSFVPSGRQVVDTFNLKFLKTSHGAYLARKWQLDERRFLIGLIPLYREYIIRNSYLDPQWNHSLFPEGTITLYESGNSLGIPVCINEHCLFRISFQDVSVRQESRLMAVILIIGSIFFLVAFVYDRIQWIRNRFSTDVAFLFLGISLLGIRLLMIYFDFPSVFIPTILFDPKNFASSDINPSLGDLLLNELWLAAICYYLFRNYYRFKILKFIFQYHIVRVVLAILSALCVFFAFLYPFVVVQTLYNNSSIIFDITQSLRFDALRIAAFVALLLAWVCAFLFAHVFIKLLISLGGIVRSTLYFIGGIILFILINESTGQLYISSLLLSIGYSIFIVVFKLYKSLRKLSYFTFAYLFTAIVALAINTTYSIYHFERKETIENQFRFASNFLVERDYFGEFLLKEVANKIADDAFIQSRISSPFLSKDAIRQKVRQVFLPSYFNKYDVSILLFSSSGIPYDNRIPITFTELINLYDKEAFKTDYDGVYFINTPAEDIPQRYLVVVPLSKSRTSAGYVVLELLMKKVIPETVYPELLVDNRFQQFYHTDDFSYAVFSSRDILFSSGDFNYERFFKREWLGDPVIHLQGVQYAGHQHIAVEDDNGRVAVVSSKLTPVLYVMANFSFILVIGLALILVLLLFQGLFNYVRGNTLFFSARIQLFINLAFFLPLIVASITTLSLISLSSQEQLNTEYLSKSRFLRNQVASMLDQFNRLEDENKIHFENQLTDLSKLSNLDVNVYNSFGELLSSSQALIFENGLFSEYINPEALNRIRQGDNLFIIKEKVGKLDYYVSYATLKSPQSGKVIGIMGIPFFQSIPSLEKVQITLLSNILNVFAGIFIVLLILSYVVSQWLTFPLRFITRLLSKTSLTKVNQPLSWNATDEIGMMVKEYNQMLYKLSESKAELERTQRETAWREIAQQVAHEIKNPLTPMKLTLQQLERALQGGIDIKEKTAKALPSLLSQVDTLNDIASSFSSFAKMPEPSIQRLELIALLKRIVTLHSQSGTINFKYGSKEMYVMGDEQLLGRIFSNIILNAFQATIPGATAYVEVRVDKINSNVRIVFEDNGKGINPSHADRIFVPHFSTKKSGSGLGLAISKQGIELMGGKIWFESTPEQVTRFFIELRSVE